MIYEHRGARPTTNGHRGMFVMKGPHAHDDANILKPHCQLLISHHRPSERTIKARKPKSVDPYCWQSSSARHNSFFQAVFVLILPVCSLVDNFHFILTIARFPRYVYEQVMSSPVQVVSPVFPPRKVRVNRSAYVRRNVSMVYDMLTFCVHLARTQVCLPVGSSQRQAEAA